MSDTEDRLVALVTQARRRGVPDDRAALVVELGARAPDLHDEIGALAAALAFLRADPAIARSHLVDAVAQQQGLAHAAVLPAVEVARLVGVAPALPPTPPAQPPDASPPVWPGVALPSAPAAGRQRWRYALAGAVLLAAIVFYVGRDAWQRSDGPPLPRPSPTPAIRPPVPTPVATGPGGDLPVGDLPVGGPRLLADDAAPPMLPVRRAASGALGIGFAIADAGTQVQGLLVLPARGWDTGNATIIGQRGAATAIGTGRFALTHAGAVPLRTMKPRWQRDGLDAGPLCILIAGQPGAADVALSGAKVCIADGGCDGPARCGIAF